jgi:hypothetical protein
LTLAVSMDVILLQVVGLGIPHLETPTVKFSARLMLITSCR